jgi:4-aminobutyrate aminotransferase
MDWVGGSHASTFGGNPLSCVAARAVIETIKEEKLLENATKQGNYIMKRLEELKEQSEIVGDVRGKGLMIGLEIVESKETKKPTPEKVSEIMVRSWKRGVAVITCGTSTIRVAPPLNITRELVDSALEILEDTVKEVEKQAKP